MVYIFFLCLFVGYAQAANDDGWAGADMKVIYHSGLFSWEAAFKGKDIFLENMSVLEAALHQVRKGYCFPPEVPELDRCINPDLREDGVRQFICHKKPFLSPTLVECLEKVEDALRDKKDLPAVRHVLWEKLTAGIASKRFIPKGKSRKWSVIDAWEVIRPSFKDRVCVVFRDKSEALEGELCYERLCLPAERTLLYFDAYVDLPRYITPADGVPANPEALLSFDCGSKYDLGIIYFPEKGERCAALVNALMFDMSTKYSWGGTVVDGDYEDATVVLKRELLKGLDLKRQSRAKKNITVLGQPQVRHCACRSHHFESEPLESFVHRVGSYLQDSHVAVQDHEFWSGLRAEHCAGICSRSNGFAWSCDKIAWSIISTEAVQRLVKDGAKGTVLVLLRGDAALKGRRVPLDVAVGSAQESLFQALSKQKVQQYRKEQRAALVKVKGALPTEEATL